MYLLWFWFYDSQVKTALIITDQVAQRLTYLSSAVNKMNWNAHRTRVIIWPVEKNRQHLQKKEHEMNKKTNALNHLCTLKLKGGNKQKSSLTEQSMLHKKYCRMLKPQRIDLKT